jgi:hypothetical protein
MGVRRTPNVKQTDNRRTDGESTPPGTPFSAPDFDLC